MNYSSILKQWQEQQQQKLESAIDRVRPWMIKLKHQGIEKIQVTYNGCHDEGCIEEIELEPDNLICLTDEARCRDRRISF